MADRLVLCEQLVIHAAAAAVMLDRVNLFAADRWL
jgi:hypothetical protein